MSLPNVAFDGWISGGGLLSLGFGGWFAEEEGLESVVVGGSSPSRRRKQWLERLLPSQRDMDDEEALVILMALYESLGGGHASQSRAH